MNLLPKIKKCPHCETLNFVRINGIIYDNEFQTLKDWTLKSKILCRKCKIEVGLFINNHDNYDNLQTALFQNPPIRSKYSLHKSFSEKQH